MFLASIRSRLFYLVCAVFAVLIIASLYVSAPRDYSSRLLDKIKKPNGDLIPNIVHYVWILKPGHSFSLGFIQFVSIYSAYFYINPDIIYIHTDVSIDEFEFAKTNGDKWTKRILNIPRVTYHRVDVPSNTTTGVVIGHLEHKSDFIRTAMLVEFGGMYFDTDAVPLRSLSALRHSGFANVLGMEKGGRTINNGIMMSAPNSILMTLYQNEQHQYFDGGWATASTILLTEVAWRLSVIEGEVLILGLNAFMPMGWGAVDALNLWKEHADTDPTLDGEQAAPKVPKVPKSWADALQWWSERRRKDYKGKEEWVIDYSNAYVLHAFDNAVVEGFKYEDVSVEYVLRRRCNYARAVYPAIKDAIDSGVI